MTMRRQAWRNFPFDTVLLATPADGNCLFHAICNAFYKSYRTEMLDGKRVSRLEIVTKLRSEIALMLQEPDMVDPKKRRYDTLGGGSLKELGDSGMQEYTLAGMQTWLRSSSSMGDEIIPFIGELLDKNFYFLDTNTKDVYITAALPDIPRNSIVMYYNGRHYDLCGIQENDATITTYFTEAHPFILHIRGILSSYKNPSATYDTSS
jgi:hypothetical protein